MEIFDLFKKFFEKDKIRKITIKKIVFSNIEEWINKKTRENELKEKEIISIIRVKIKNFIQEIEVKIIVLERFNIETRKEKEQIKNVVVNSKEKYIESIEDFIMKLNNLEEVKLKKFIEKVNKIFLDFNKSSSKNYERATILIGNEMASIKESLKNFSKVLLKIFNENKFLINYFEDISIIKEKLNSINSLEKNLKKISENKSLLDKKIIQEEKEHNILREKIEEIKKSKNYLDNLSNKKEIELLKSILKKDLLELNNLINFKDLTNFFHINFEQMKIIKDYRENFQKNFEKDNGKIILELLKEAKLSNDKILEKINHIKIKKEEIANHEKDIRKDETQEIYLKIKEVNLQLENLKEEKIKETKRKEKLKINKEKLINILKKDLSQMGIEII